MPMIVPIGSCVGSEGWSRFGERVTRLCEPAAETGELVAVVDEPGPWMPMATSDGMAVEVVFVFAVRDADDVVTVSCTTAVFGLCATELVTLLSRGSGS